MPLLWTLCNCDISQLPAHILDLLFRSLLVLLGAGFSMVEHWDSQQFSLGCWESRKRKTVAAVRFRLRRKTTGGFSWTTGAKAIDQTTCVGPQSRATDAYAFGVT